MARTEPTNASPSWQPSNDEIREATRMIRSTKPRPSDDEVQDALLRATESFDPNRGAKFSTYAVSCARWKGGRGNRLELADGREDYESGPSVWGSSEEGTFPDAELSRGLDRFIEMQAPALQSLLWASEAGPDRVATYLRQAIEGRIFRVPQRAVFGVKAHGVPSDSQTRPRVSARGGGLRSTDARTGIPR